MERLTEHVGNYIRVKGCETLYPNEERKTAPASNAIVRLAAYEDAIPLERAQELSQAEKDGRLTVLPCKVGDMVYYISDGTPCATRALRFLYSGDHWACQTVSSYPDFEKFESRLFLTREEAEAALKKREADDEAD